jgi:type I restriction enzyme S subunit
MTFPRYAKYKDSGVEWLGDIPSDWAVEKFRHLFGESSEKIEGAVVGPMLSVSGYRGIEIKEYDDDNRRRLEDDLQGYRIVRMGQLVVNTMWLNYAGLGVSEFEGHVSPAYRSYEINKELDKRFVHHLMRSSVYVQGYTRLLTGIRPNSLQMSRDDLMEFPILKPPRGEQAGLATFLDRESNKVDALVAEQQRLIELLKEKRQAVISHAVTKGLDPEAPTKPSGTEWLGEVPAHWEMTKIKYLSDSIEQGWSPQCEGYPTETETEWGVLKVGCVNGGKFNPSENKLLPPELEPVPELAISNGDLLISRANTRELVGSAALAEHDYRHLMLCDKLYRVRISPDRCSAKFVCFYLASTAVRGQIELEATGASPSMVNIGQAAIMELIIAVPPLNEQWEIIASIGCELAQLDALSLEAQRAIDLLQERRAALISAVISGKIDVRALVPTNAEAA